MRSLISTSTHSRAHGALTALAALVVLVGGALAHGVATPGSAEGADPPNIVFILTDDQAAHEMAALPTVRAEIGAKGATFTRAYAPYPLCCPARATLLGGQYMHNHGVRGNGGEFGGWSRFEPREDAAFPVRLRGSGYHTIHVGKYMNLYASGGSASCFGPPGLPVPPGWSEWYGKISEAELYYDYRLIEDPDGSGGLPAQCQGYGDEESDYQTDVLADKAVDFIGGPGDPPTPFHLNFWVNAPHAPFVPAPRHLYDFGGTKLPWLKGFNERRIKDKPKWLRRQAGRLRIGVRRRIAAERRRRLEQLLSVDEAVGRILEELESEGELDNTYVIFTSDHGFFRGEHRIAGGKYLPHEPSSRVPLMIRGPGIPAGARSAELVSLADVTQTILRIGTGSANSSLDGRSLLPYAKNPGARTTRPILLEADTGPGRGNNGFDEAVAAAAKAGLAGKGGVGNLDQEPGVSAAAKKAAATGNFAPAYRAIRTNRYLLVLYANGQRELYDMALDPAQLRSVAANRRYRPVRRWLFKRLFRLSRCRGATCRVQVGPDPRPKPKRKKKGKRRR
jgi:N-acetylglucosamine-6-sulfatase